jgi:hypothetical protein
MINYKLKRLELKLNLLNITNDNLSLNNNSNSTNNNSLLNNDEDYIMTRLKSPLSSGYNLNNNNKPIFNYLVTPSCSSPILSHSTSCNSPSFCSRFKTIKGVYIWNCFVLLRLKIMI